MRGDAGVLVIRADFYNISDRVSGFVDTKRPAIFGGVSILAAISFIFHQDKTF